MDLKEKLNNLRNKLAGKKQTTNTVINRELTSEEKELLEGIYQSRENTATTSIESARNIDLNTKINNFINWYFKNVVKNNYTELEPIDMRNFIEKMAVWYELRYPDYEVNRLMPGSDQDGTKIDDVMFNDNSYINNLFDENSDVRIIDWDKFYNTEAFINSLPKKEAFLFGKPKYRNTIYINYGRKIRLYLTSEGYIQSSAGVSLYTGFAINDEQLKDMHVIDVLRYFKKEGIVLPKNNELEECIKDIQKWNYQKEEMLNCVMYRIIERGGNRIGPRRAFLFAKEFGRNIDIPMKYAIDYSDPGLRSFIIEYIKAGGFKNLVCYVGYFNRAHKNEKMDTVTIQEMLKTIHHDSLTKYTPEETELHQKIVNLLANEKEKRLTFKSKEN